MTTKKPRGAYATYAGKPAAKKFIRQVTLDDRSAEILKAYGDGNLSLGVRMAAAFIDDWQTNEVNK